MFAIFYLAFLCFVEDGSSKYILKPTILLDIKI